MLYIHKYLCVPIYPHEFQLLCLYILYSVHSMFEAVGLVGKETADWRTLVQNTKYKAWRKARCAAVEWRSIVCPCWEWHVESFRVCLYWFCLWHRFVQVGDLLYRCVSTNLFYSLLFSSQKRRLSWRILWQTLRSWPTKYAPS